MRPSPGPRSAFGSLSLDRETRVAFAGDAQVTLSEAEAATLAVLIERRHGPMTREAVVDVLATRGVAIAPRMVDVVICRVRQKLAPIGMDAVILTVWGRGYMVGDPPRDDGGSLTPAGGGSLAVLIAA